MAGKQFSRNLQNLQSPPWRLGSLAPPFLRRKQTAGHTFIVYQKSGGGKLIVGGVKGMTGKAFFTINDLCGYLGVSRDTLERYRKRHEIFRPSQVLGKKLFHARQVEFIEAVVVEKYTPEEAAELWNLRKQMFAPSADCEVDTVRRRKRRTG